MLLLLEMSWIGWEVNHRDQDKLKLMIRCMNNKSKVIEGISKFMCVCECVYQIIPAV